MRWSAPVPLGLLAAGLLVVAGCGGEEPEALQPMKPEVPADLCATIPAAARAGLESNSNTDASGNPTAACSLRSNDTGTSQVRAVVTWVQLNDDVSANTVLDSQCRSIDRAEFREQVGLRVEGADRACAGVSKAGGADSVTMSAVAQREVVTVRYVSDPAGRTPALQRGRQMLEGVLASMAG